MQPCYCVRRHGEPRARILTAAMMARFFDNRDPRDWTDPILVCPTEWVA